MSLQKLFRNPQTKSITKKYIFILIIGLFFIGISTKLLVNEVNKIIIKQNTILFSNAISDKDLETLSKDIYTLKDEKSYKKAKKVLETYGYDENMSFEANYLGKYITKRILIIFSFIFVLFISILYFFYIRELKGIFIEINKMSSNICSIYDGNYKPLDDKFTEGDIAILNSNLNYMGERVNNSIYLLKKDKENIKDFLSDISHQLKTPLSSLIMFNDLLRENEDMPYDTRVEFLNKSEEQLSRMEWLIMNLLKVGRLDAGVIKFDFEEGVILDTVKLALSPLENMAMKKHQKITICGDKKAKLVHDKQWLAEALTNIIKNSIEHTQNNGEINIEIVKGKIITKIIISDNGEGIKKEMQNKIFKRFYKGEKSRNPKSIGIGLSLAKSIIEAQNGEIRLFSEVGKGTTFIISFMEDI